MALSKNYKSFFIISIFVICFTTINIYATENMKVTLELGVDSKGKESSKWIAAITDRHPLDKVKAIEKELTPLTEKEKIWLKLFKEVVPGWNKERAMLNSPFDINNFPKNLTILFGNNGGNDGFSYNNNTICCDLSSWVGNYETPRVENLNESKDRIKHILSHEYTHILTHLWLKQHPYNADTPLKRALFECWLEGLGNYYSFSSSWYSTPDTLSPKAFRILKQLEPIFVDRLIRLSKTTNKVVEQQLMRGLSKASFTKKWGAVTVALWLRLDTHCDNKWLTPWIKKGPEGVLLLAKKYLPKKEKEKLFKDKDIKNMIPPVASPNQQIAGCEVKVTTER